MLFIVCLRVSTLHQNMLSQTKLRVSYKGRNTITPLRAYSEFCCAIYYTSKLFTNVIVFVNKYFDPVSNEEKKI